MKDKSNQWIVEYTGDDTCVYPKIRVYNTAGNAIMGLVSYDDVLRFVVAKDLHAASRRYCISCKTATGVQPFYLYSVKVEDDK